MGQPRADQVPEEDSGSPPSSSEFPSKKSEPSQNATHQPQHSNSSWRHLFVFTECRHVGLLGLAVAAALLVAVAKTLYAIFLGKIMDIVSSLGAGSIGGEAAMVGVANWCVVLTTVGVAIWIFNSAFMTLWVIFGELMAKSARESLFSNLLGKEMAWFDSQDEGVSSALSSMQTQTRELQMAVSQVFGFLLSDAFISVGCLIEAFYYSWQLTLVLIATVPVSVVGLSLVSRGLEAEIEAQKRELAQASKYVTAAVTAIDLVKVYNGFDHEVWQYMQTIKKAMGHYLQQARKNAGQMGFIQLWMINLFVVGFYFAVWLVNRGLTTPGNALTTFYAAMTALQCIENVGPQWLVLAKGMSAGYSLQRIVLDIAEGKQVLGMKGSHRPEKCAGDIELNNVSFAYPSNPDRTVLGCSSLFFPSGEMTFLVGRSGSGKSTLSNLLLKFYKPLTGNILIDGHPIQTLDDAWVRGNVTLIQQSSILFNDTVFRNVAFGHRDPSSVTREEVKAACETALLQSTLAGLPHGLDTNVGMGAYNLSGGQKQRIALARARLRDSPVMILDEVTSGLDPVSRGLILEAIRIWRMGKTTIIITHDVAQIQNEDYVYVLDKSFLVQEGFRRDLAREEGGLFASLVAQTDEGRSTGSSTDTLRSITSSSEGFSLSESPDATPVVSTSRFSSVLPHSDTSTSGQGVFSTMSLGAGTYRTTMMRTKGLWNAPISLTEVERGRGSRSDSEKETRRSHSALLHKASKRRRNPRDTNSFGYRPPQSRKASIDVVQERGETTRARRPSRLMRIRPAQNDQQVNKKKDSTASTISTSRDSIPDARRCGDESTTKRADPKQKARNVSLFAILGTVWPILDRPNRVRAVLGLISCLVAAACNPTFAYVFAQLLAAFWAPASEMTSVGQTWAIRLAIIAAVAGATTFSAHYLMQWVGQGWVTALRIEALKRMLSQPKQWFDKPRHAPLRIVEVLDRNAEEMHNLVGRFVPVVLIVMGMILSSLIWALAISWKLTLVTLASGPVVYAATSASASVSAKWEARCNAGAQATESVAVETFLNIRVTRALTLEDYFSSKHARSAAETFRIGVKRGLWTGLFFGLSQGMSWWLTALVFYYGTVLLTSPNAPVKVADMLQVINLLLFSLGTSTAMMNNIPQIAQAKASAIQILYYATLSYSNSHEAYGQKRALTPFPVEMSRLQFAYPAAKNGRDAPSKVLRNVNLRIEGGGCIAVVGASGCGKSTIANLLLRLYEPLGTSEAKLEQDPESPPPRRLNQRGLHLGSSTRQQNHPRKGEQSLTFGHVPASDLSTSILRSLMAYVPQQPFLFPATIRENIVYGLHPDSPLRDLSSVVAAAKLVCIHDFIVSLPDSYATVVGEGGIGLSGGQAQRLSIARALVRSPKLLVMDEPTSALDADGAEGVRNAIQGLIERGRRAVPGEEKMGVVVVTHSKEMMRMAGRIVMMDQGFVAEEGGYEELLSRRGKFADMVGGGVWITSTGTGTGFSAKKGKLKGVKHRQPSPFPSEEDRGEEEELGLLDPGWRTDIWNSSTATTAGADESMYSEHRISTAREDALQRLEGPPRQVQVGRVLRKETE